MSNNNNTQIVTYTLVNKVPELIKNGEKTEAEVKAAIILAGLSPDTMTRVLDGETGFNANTLAKIAFNLGYSTITKIVDLKTITPQEEPEENEPQTTN